MGSKSVSWTKFYKFWNLNILNNLFNSVTSQYVIQNNWDHYAFDFPDFSSLEHGMQIIFLHNLKMVVL